MTQREPRLRHWSTSAQSQALQTTVRSGMTIHLQEPVWPMIHKHALHKGISGTQHPLLLPPLAPRNLHLVRKSILKSLLYKDVEPPNRPYVAQHVFLGEFTRYACKNH